MMHYTKFLILILAIVSHISAVELILQDGKRISGKCVKQDYKTVTIKEAGSGSIVDVPRDQIAQIRYPYATSDFYRGQTIFPEEYFSVGISIGMPSVLNVSLGYNFWLFGITLSGGYFGKTYGVESILHLKLLDDPWATIAPYVSAGTSRLFIRDELKQFDYLSAGGIFTLWGFFVRVGLAIGEGTYSNPQLVGELGITLKII